DPRAGGAALAPGARDRGHPEVGRPRADGGQPGPVRLLARPGGGGEDRLAGRRLTPAAAGDHTGRMGERGFLPSEHGFAFTNSWPSAPAIEIPTRLGTVGVGNASPGLCGGLGFAAR